MGEKVTGLLPTGTKRAPVTDVAARQYARVLQGHKMPKRLT